MATKDFAPWEKSEFLWDMMGKMGYEAFTPGETELLEGIDAIKGMFSRSPNIQVVSANIRDKAGNLIWPEYTIIEKQGVRFGVTGVTGPSFYSFNVSRGTQRVDEFTFDDPNEALDRIMPKLEAESDLVVVLYHLSPGDARRAVDELPGIDVMVVGHNPGYMFNPDRMANTLMVRGGNRGQYLSVLELTLDENGREVLDYSGEGKPLGKDVDKDPALEPVVTDWEADWEKRKRENQRQKAADKAMLQGTEKFVGAEVCARCHLEEYNSWANTAHAKAYATLEETDQETEAQCLSCHVVGYDQPTGFGFGAEVDRLGNPIVRAEDTKLKNVQCESCHGMGTFHGTPAMVAKPSEETCITCHTGEFGKNFNYADALANGHVH